MYTVRIVVIEFPATVRAKSMSHNDFSFQSFQYYWVLLILVYSMALVIAMEAEIIILVEFDTLKVYYKSSIFYH